MMDVRKETKGREKDLWSLNQNIYWAGVPAIKG